MNASAHMRPLDSAISRQLNEARRSAGITVSQLAEHVGMRYDLVNDKMRGATSLRLHELVIFAAAIGADPGRLVRDAVAVTGTPVTRFPASMLRRCRYCRTLIDADAHSRTVLCGAEECHRQAQRDHSAKYLDANRDEVNARQAKRQRSQRARARR